MKYKAKDEPKVEEKGDYAKQVIFSKDDFADNRHLLEIVIIPKQTARVMHYYYEQTQVCYVLMGNAIITVNGKIFHAKPGDACILEPGDKHTIANENDQDFHLLVFKINIPEKDDTVWKEQ